MAAFGLPRADWAWLTMQIAAVILSTMQQYYGHCGGCKTLAAEEAHCDEVLAVEVDQQADRLGIIQKGQHWRTALQKAGAAISCGPHHSGVANVRLPR